MDLLQFKDILVALSPVGVFLIVVLVILPKYFLPSKQKINTIFNHLTHITQDLNTIKLNTIKLLEQISILVIQNEKFTSRLLKILEKEVKE